MKRILTLVCATVVAFACSGNNVKYVVTGANAPKDGAAVHVVDQISKAPVCSAVVSGGAFEMKGTAEKDAFLAVVIDGVEGQFLFFNDGKPVRVDVAEGTLTGSALNSKLSECDRKNKEEYAAYYKVVEDFESLPEEEQMVKAEEWMAQYQAALKKYAEFYTGIIEENKDNIIPVAFAESFPGLVSAANGWDKKMGEDRLDEVLASNRKLATHPYIIDLKRRMEEADALRAKASESRRSSVGEKFRDLEEPDVNGKMHKLSEYVGQGKWVLVDFWASWCGPCKAEMPNVVAAYKKYHDKGFDIVGLSFDEEKDPWVKAIREWDMPWIHLSDLKYWETVAREVYSVDGIPDNILIDPEGTIVARGLRGDALEARLAEVLR